MLEARVFKIDEEYIEVDLVWEDGDCLFVQCNMVLKLNQSIAIMMELADEGIYPDISLMKKKE